MPVWCPQCNAMLNEGLEKCPRCGARLPGAGQTRAAADAGQAPIDRKETVQITLFLLAFLLIPVLLMLIAGLICVAVGASGG